MKKIGIFLTFLLLFSNLLFGVTDKELATTINLSGKQRMLIQKMTKEALLIHIGLDKEKSIENLKESSSLFDKTLQGLINGDKSLSLVKIENKDISKQLDVVNRLWKPFYREIKKILSNRADESSYEFLEKNNMSLLKEMNRAVELYSSLNREESKFKLANDINLAGKERMLTQRMAKDILAIKNNLNIQKYIKDFKESRSLFSKILKGLQNGDKDLKLVGTDIPNIVNQLKIVDKSWKDMQPILDNALKGKDIEKAIEMLDNLLIEMNRCVTLYTKSVNRYRQRNRFASILSNFMYKNKILKRRVNLSGKQRMLIQRITKLALLVSSNIDREKNIEKLKKYSNLYDKTLKAFKNGDKDLNCVPTTDKEIRKQIDIVEKSWKPFYRHIQNIINLNDKDKKSLLYIVNENENLLKVSDDLVKAYEKSDRSQNYLEKARLHIINIAGRQRMLSQKMTKEKLLIIQGKTEYISKLQDSIKLFDDSLNSLINGNSRENIIKPTNEKIKEQLAKIYKIWSKLKPLYEKEKLSHTELETIIRENPLLLSEINSMVEMAQQEREY